MANSAAYDRIKRETLTLVSRIPAGYVSTHGDIGRQLAVQTRHVAHILAELDATERDTTPWWRIVAQGGAIGRHTWRDDQIARLKKDGITLSGAGIVQDMADRRVKDLSNPPAVPLARPGHTTAGGSGRSRGMKSHPSG
jgi:alkylated DNA nucleotide flippase Atl1